MELEQLLQKRKKDLVQRWFQAVMETYSADATRFFKNNKDSFTNPVGNAFRTGLSELFDRLMDTGENDPQKIGACLDPMIRIRAVQNFMPSEALGFMFHLKKIIRQSLGDALQDAGIAEAFSDLEWKIDAFGLIAFNIYVKCKEQVYQLKSDEIRERTFKAFKRAGLVYEITQTKPDLDHYH